MSRWRKTPDGRSVTSVGEHGTKVRLFQNRPNGVFYRVVWNPATRRKDWKSLKTRDREEALRRGRQLCARLVTGLDELTSGRVSLGPLWRRFSTQCQAYLDNKPATQTDAALRARILLAYFGESCDVSRLTADDVQAFRARRLAGGLKVGERVLQRCRERSVEADLILLNQMLRWATTVWQDGKRWLAANPLAGVARHREQNPRRPVATVERFEKTVAAIQELGRQARTEEERVRWLKMELALRLAEGTGRRLGSIRQLRWEDNDAGAGTIRWRAEHDKKGRESIIPYPPALLTEVRRIQVELQAVGGWVFPGERLPNQPMDRHLFDKWLTVAERKAGLPKLEGGLWHPYRRAWATARKHHPVTDVAQAGGWTDVETLLRCYQRPEKETLLRVTGEERKVHDHMLSA